MKRFQNIAIFLLCLYSFVGCTPEHSNHTVERALCNFEGSYWSALVDSNPNGDNLLNGTISPSWRDKNSGLCGAVCEPYSGYWEGTAVSNHCSLDCVNDGTHDKQLVAYVESAYSGSNFLICNSFLGTPIELRFEDRSCFIESMMVANTAYSRNAVENGYRMTDGALPENRSIWIEASGYINGSDEVQATAKFYLYRDGQPAFEGWKKWYMTSMCKIDKIVFEVKWNGEGYNPFPAYFAIDDIKVVWHEEI